jgi:hypothetical protein
MARANLGSLLGVANAGTPDATIDEPQAPAAPTRQAPAAAPTPAEKTPAAKTTPAPRTRQRRPAATPTPGHWSEYERLEARLRDDQVEELDALARRLNKQRGQGEGERITKNTLLRVATDLLLANTADAAGTTEKEIRSSLGL